ncbi:MAG TPA: serine hydrolase [Calditrichia bacterium]|nr:serine hydrolase [Calditrichia bacterium]HQV32564.1 serine hydrolase [Calditrichia bacterium]
MFLLISGAAPKTRTPDPLPITLSDAQVKPLRKLVDKSLQNALEQALDRNPHWRKLINRKKMAVGVVDLTRPEAARFARVNGNQMMYAASLPKLAILLAAQQALKDGKIEDSPQLRENMQQMIARSSNAAATAVYSEVGGAPYVESVLRNKKYELYDPNYGGGLWVGKPYAKGGKRYPDPVMGTSHGATVTQVCRFYYLLALGRLIDPAHSADMLAILRDPDLHHKFVNSLDSLAPDATVYRKSGTWRNWHSDSVMVWGPHWRRYILVALVEDGSGEQICRDLVPVVESVLQGRFGGP